MKMKLLPFNQKYLQSILDYSIITGKFYWKVNKGSRAKIDKVAGCSGKDNRRQIRIDKKTYLASRLAWMWVSGEDPYPYEIDHVNPARPFDNSWVNIRKATRKQNTQNMRSTNKFRLKGASRHRNAFQAQIRISGKKIRLGTFNTPEEAHNAYCEVAKELHGEFFRA